MATFLFCRISSWSPIPGLSKHFIVFFFLQITPLGLDASGQPHSWGAAAPSRGDAFQCNSPKPSSRGLWILGLVVQTLLSARVEKEGRPSLFGRETILGPSRILFFFFIFRKILIFFLQLSSFSLPRIAQAQTDRRSPPLNLPESALPRPLLIRQRLEGACLQAAPPFFPPSLPPCWSRGRNWARSPSNRH